MKKWMTPEVEELEINETACCHDDGGYDSNDPECPHKPVDDLSGATEIIK